MAKEQDYCEHKWGTGVTLYDSPTCSKCGKKYEHDLPE